MSLPARERGLKRQGGWGMMDTVLMSLPARERGLKPLLLQTPAAVRFVAPRKGAWIET